MSTLTERGALTLRDQFALAALPAVIAETRMSLTEMANTRTQDECDMEMDCIAIHAYELADAMLRVRSGRQAEQSLPGQALDHYGFPTTPQ